MRRVEEEDDQYDGEDKKEHDGNPQTFLHWMTKTKLN